MTDKYLNKYRIASHRKPNWDYSANSIYFITLVTQYRECNLGHIRDNKICLSEFGKIVRAEWLKSFEIRDELFLDEWIIMPNHLHAIIILDNNEPMHDDEIETWCNHENQTVRNGEIEIRGVHGNKTDPDGKMETRGLTVETHGRASLRLNRPNHPHHPNFLDHSHHPCHSDLPDGSHHPNQPDQQPHPYRKPKSISSFIAGFKSATNSKIDDYIDEKQLDMAKYNRNNHFWQPNYHDHIIRSRTEYYRIQNYITNNPLNWCEDKLYE